MLGGYWIGNNTPSILEISPKLLLIIGVGLGLSIGYVVDIARGIMRVINVTQKEDVFLSTGKSKWIPHFFIETLICFMFLYCI